MACFNRRMNSIVQVNQSVPSRSPSFTDESIQRHISDFLAAMDCSDLTREHYRKRLKQFLLWVENSNQRQVQRQTVLDYKRWLKEQKYEASTIGADLRPKLVPPHAIHRGRASHLEEFVNCQHCNCSDQFEKLHWLLSLFPQP